MSIEQGYVYKVLLALDLFCCALLFRDPDVTISAEVGKAMRRPNPPWWARTLNQCLDAIQPGHCQRSIQWDIDRAEAAIRYLRS